MPPKSLIVIGAGPGGYAAAIEAAQRGLSVTLIDSQEMGGTCLNRGCIPSKFYLSKAKHAAEPMSPIQELLDQKNTVLTTLRQRMEQGAKAAGVQRINGLAKFLSANEVEVSMEGNDRRMKADFVILATGSSPVVPSL